jgi:hypothetical protein
MNVPGPSVETPSDLSQSRSVEAPSQGAMISNRSESPHSNSAVSVQTINDIPFKGRREEFVQPPINFNSTPFNSTRSIQPQLSSTPVVCSLPMLASQLQAMEKKVCGLEDRLDHLVVSIDRKVEKRLSEKFGKWKNMEERVSWQEQQVQTHFDKIDKMQEHISELVMADLDRLRLEVQQEVRKSCPDSEDVVKMFRGWMEKELSDCWNCLNECLENISKLDPQKWSDTVSSVQRMREEMLILSETHVSREELTGLRADCSRCSNQQNKMAEKLDCMAGMMLEGLLNEISELQSRQSRKNSECTDSTRLDSPRKDNHSGNIELLDNRAHYIASLLESNGDGRVKVSRQLLRRISQAVVGEAVGDTLVTFAGVGDTLDEGVDNDFVPAVQVAQVIRAACDRRPTRLSDASFQTNVSSDRFACS